ncbi:MAG TPA: hypothetical protein VJ183_02520 [Chloroflexia bacterium]|nr:hypothetical protein [Chloroflexia bacterium]
MRTLRNGSVEELPLFIDATEAANLLHVGRSKMYELARTNGGLPGQVRLGKLLRFHTPTLLAGLAEQSAVVSQVEHPETASKWEVGGAR